MPFTPFNFDDSAGQTEPGRVRVPEGYYLFECEKVEPTAQDFAGTTGMYFHYVIRDGAMGVGRGLRDYCALGAKQTQDGRGTQFGFARALGALGQAQVAKQLAAGKVAIDSYTKLTGLCAQLSARVKGQQCVALVGDETVNGRTISSVQELLPATDWASLKGTLITSAARPAMAPSAATPNGTPAATADVGSLNAEIDAMFNLPAA